MRLAWRPLAAGMLAAAAAQAMPPEGLEAIVRERLASADSPACIAASVIGEQALEVFACGPGAGPSGYDADSIFAIGSVTKGLTGLLLADMVVRGELALDDPASRHSRPGASLPRGAREITLRDLVTHTSGLPRTPPGHEPRDPANPYGHYDAEALYASLARTRLAREPGAGYEYSNLGFMWLSEILARRAGTSYEALLKERVLAPLGMDSSGVTLAGAQQARAVKGHDRAYREVAAWTIGADLEGVGLVRSTLRDMMRLAEALAGRRSTPLDAAIALALEPPAPRAAPHVAFAWNIGGDDDARRHEHGGGVGGFGAHLAFDRGRKRAAVVLADAEVSIFDLAVHLVDGRYHLRRRPEAAPLSAPRRREYPGRYALAEGDAVEVHEDGARLLARFDGMAAELFHQGGDAFFVQVADVQLVFGRDSGGRIEGLTLYRDGRERRARRR